MNDQNFLQYSIYSRATSLRLTEFLDEEHISIQCRNTPGVDDLAAAFGLYCFFRAAGKKVKMFYAGQHPIARPNVTEMINQLGIPVNHKPHMPHCKGLLIAAGCQPGEQETIKISSDTFAVLDNHPRRIALPEQCDVRPHLTCCSTLVWHLLQQADFLPDRQLATAFMYALHIESNSFMEIRFPLDRDMRDTLVIDEELFKKLERSNLSLQDLAATAQALNALEYHAEGRFALVNVLPCDPSILNFISTLAMRVNKVDIAVVFSETDQGIRFSACSAVRDVQAADLALWFTANQLGVAGGTNEQAGGHITPHAYADTPPLHFFLERVQSYLNSFAVIDCAALQRFNTQGFRAYQKLPVPLAYIRCEDVFAEGATVHIRMLEGDISLIADKNTYLMIGLRGEVYPVAKEKFQAIYTMVDAPVAAGFLYPPTVTQGSDGTRVELLQYAASCISKENRVLARQLEQGVKIFTRWDSRRYIRGNPGDWLVQAKNDATDLYIITQELFPTLYRAIR